MQPNTRGDPSIINGYLEQPQVWFQNHYEPEFICSLERRIGRLGDGGKWVCNPHVISSQPKCLVYSVGSNGDASFEAAILQDVSDKCEIHVFDFGSYAASVKQQTKHSPNVYYHEWGISDFTGGVFKTLQDTVQELGHVGRTIDIFKIDCEGCELDTFSSWFQADVTLKQILGGAAPAHVPMATQYQTTRNGRLFSHTAQTGIRHYTQGTQYTISGKWIVCRIQFLAPFSRVLDKQQ